MSIPFRGVSVAGQVAMAMPRIFGVRLLGEFDSRHFEGLTAQNGANLFHDETKGA
ncbi:hypothetical protein RYZ27_02270 [Hyphomonas sp. FCG-A18]|jgi:hypothetical protein|uniref:hypothetical protein n=1 Tax=Hyphomonas sp. FCG-A18 TaxID=3080019 RepID=UPI002B303855|nr:hypothetical protein RYZ27_02270 [Hyphomonas sp. FCG-A18]